MKGDTRRMPPRDADRCAHSCVTIVRRATGTRLLLPGVTLVIFAFKFSGVPDPGAGIGNALLLTLAVVRHLRFAQLGSHGIVREVGKRFPNESTQGLSGTP